MSRLHALAVELARESGRNANVVEYGLKVGIYNLVSMACVLLAGWALRVLPEVLAAYIAAGSLRIAGGGVHTSTPALCTVVSTAVYGAAGLLGHALGPLIGGAALEILAVAVYLWLLLAIVRFAPRDVPAKPIPPERRAKLRRLALTVWAVWGGITWWALAAEVRSELVLAAVLGLTLQSLSLVPSANKDERRRQT
ncbi:MAG: accessory gene regulator B family protein [Bacillota bacterium]|nr:accessory gene regulator B family protein [Bacillota bacterium]